MVDIQGHQLSMPIKAFRVPSHIGAEHERVIQRTMDRYRRKRLRHIVVRRNGPLSVVRKRRFDVFGFMAYDSSMTDDETNPPQADPLTVGELISLQDAAEYAGLSRDSLQGYIRRGRLKAKKVGPIWVTTRAAVDDYLQSRSFENIPRKYRRT